MSKTVQRILWVVGLFVLAVSIASSTVYASSADVGIEPAYPVQGNDRTRSIYIMSLKAGEEGANGIRLINNGKEAHIVNIYPVDSSVSVDGSFSCRQKAEEVKAVGGWVTLDKTDLTIEPGEQVVVDFTVKVPSGTGPGEHNGCIAVQDQKNLPAKSGEGILLGFRSAIRLSITTPGKIIKKLTINTVEVERQKDGSYQVSPIAKNEGNVSLDVKSYAQLESIFGQLSKLKNDATCIVMPGATMACPYVFERPYWGGIYKAKTSLSYDADPLTEIGQTESKQQRVRKDSAWFVAFPDPLAGAAELAVLLVILWFIITPIRRRLRKRHVLSRWEKHIVTEGETLMSIAHERGAKWRTIAKHNRLKAPYLIEAGVPIIVPKVVATKTRKQRSKVWKSELDWFDDESTDLAANEAPVSRRTAIATTAAKPRQEQPKEPQTRSEEALESQTPTYGGWVSPRSSSYQDEEEFDEDSVDWREGADESELKKLENIKGLTAVPKIKSIWDSGKAKNEKPKKHRKKRTK